MTISLTARSIRASKREEYKAWYVLFVGQMKVPFGALNRVERNDGSLGPFQYEDRHGDDVADFMSNPADLGPDLTKALAKVRAAVEAQSAHRKGEHEAELQAEGAWLRAAENHFDPAADYAERMEAYYS